MQNCKIDEPHENYHVKKNNFSIGKRNHETILLKNRNAPAHRFDDVKLQIMQYLLLFSKIINDLISKVLLVTFSTLKS